MEFWFARHGQTEWNAERRFQGRSNSPLTELGRQQAMDQGENLRRNVPNLYETDLVISPLGRVIETVEIALPGMVYRIDDDLMEHDVGPISGLSLAERVAIDPRFGSENSDDVLAAYYSIKGGESYPKFSQRIKRAMARVQRPTIIFAHGIVGFEVRANALGLIGKTRRSLRGGQGVVYHIKDGVERRLELKPS